MEVLIQANNQLGEGPVWDHRNNELLWVDIEKRTLNFFNFISGTEKNHSFGHRLGAVIPIENSTNYLLALQNGLAFFNRENESLTYISNPESEIENNRFNDGKCDPAGRFWIGSMDVNAANDKGSLYYVDDFLTVIKMLSNATIPNGLAWTETGKQMYYIDTATRSVTQFDFDIGSGAIKNPEIVIKVPKEMGLPDGMCIDTEGMLWIANWGGANISRWNPLSGQLLQKVGVPALHVTSLCFGGINLDTLFITSAKAGLSKKQLIEYPLSGSVFKYSPDIPGLRSAFFKLSH